MAAMQLGERAFISLYPMSHGSHHNGATQICAREIVQQIQAAQCNSRLARRVVRIWSKSPRLIPPPSGAHSAYQSPTGLSLACLPPLQNVPFRLPATLPNTHAGLLHLTRYEDGSGAKSQHEKSVSLLSSQIIADVP